MVLLHLMNFFRVGNKRTVHSWHDRPTGIRGMGGGGERRIEEMFLLTLPGYD